MARMAYAGRARLQARRADVCPLDRLSDAARAACRYISCDGVRLFSDYRDGLVIGKRAGSSSPEELHSKAQAVALSAGTAAVLRVATRDQSGNANHFTAVSDARMATLVAADGTPYTKPSGVLAHQVSDNQPGTYVPDYQRSGTLGLPTDASAFEHWHDCAFDPERDPEEYVSFYTLYFSKDHDFLNLEPYGLYATGFVGLQPTVVLQRWMNGDQASCRYDSATLASEYALRVVIPENATTHTVNPYFNGALWGDRATGGGFTFGNFTLADATEVGLCVEPLGLKPRCFDAVFAGNLSAADAAVLDAFLLGLRTP